MAGVLNELRISTYYFVKAHVKKGSIVPEPKMIRRPDRADEQDKRRPLTGDDLVTALAMKGIGRVRYTPKGDEPAPAELTLDARLDAVVDDFVASLEDEG